MGKEEPEELFGANNTFHRQPMTVLGRLARLIDHFVVAVPLA